MTCKNNRAHLLSIIKLCASFYCHMWIQTGVTVRKRLSGVMTSVTLTFDLWPWPFAWTSHVSMVITSENFMMIRSQEHSEKGVTGRRTDGQTDGRTEPFIELLGRSLKHLMYSNGINSLWLIDAMRRHRSGPTLAHVMACYLRAPSHYLNQCWLIISTARWYLSEGSFTRDASAVNTQISLKITYLTLHSNVLAHELHYNDGITSAMESQITGLLIVCSTVCSGTDQRKHQSSASLAFVRGIHRWPVNSPHKAPVTQKRFPFDDVII